MADEVPNGDNNMDDLLLEDDYVSKKERNYLEYFFYGIGGEQAHGSPNGKRWPPPMDTYNTRGAL